MLYYQRDRKRTDMPRTDQRFPSGMADLPPAVRAKAIEIASALVEEARDGGFAIRVGIARARTWAERIRSHEIPEDSG